MGVHTYTLTQSASTTYKCRHLSIPKGVKNKVNFLERFKVQGLIYSCMYVGVCIVSFKAKGLTETGVKWKRMGLGGWGVNSRSGVGTLKPCSGSRVMAR